MDRLHWKPRWQASSDEELAEKLVDIVGGDDWVIDGNYKGTLGIRLARAQIALVLDIPVWLSLMRVARRWLAHMGRTRPDMGEGCREKWTFDWAFFKWIVTWPQRKHRTLERLAEHPHLQVRVLKRSYSYSELLGSLRQTMAAERAAQTSPVRHAQR